MTKETYLNLKQELKDLAVKIRESKADYKNSQRAFSTRSKNGTFNDYYEGKIDSATWETIRPEYNKAYNKQVNEQQSLQSMRSEYRHKHIIYSLARGRTMEQIEPKVREGNEPSSYELNRLKKLYDFDKVEEPVAV